LWAQMRLEEAGGGLRATGNSVTLSCRGSGFSFDYYDIRWYRQSLGGTLEWVSCIGPYSSVNKSGPAIEGRALLSKNNSDSESSLSLWALQPQDSAHYFCATSHG
ncbi:HV01 protein, partial [Malurus elegans]|nr:HV01 protein [Malurus elegans]